MTRYPRMVVTVKRCTSAPVAQTVTDPAGPQPRRGRSGFGLFRLQLLLGALAGMLLLAEGDGSGDGGGTGDGGQGSGDGGSGDGTGTGSADGGTADGKGADGKTDDDGDGKDDDGDETVTMSKAALEKRLDRERRKIESDLKAKADREKLDDTERAKAEKADAEKAAKDATDRANTRLVRADAKVAALDAGANPKRVDALLKLADLADVDVSDDGDPDPKQVRKAIDAALKEYPEFKAGAGNGSGGASGGEHGGSPKGKAKNLEDAVAARLGG